MLTASERRAFQRDFSMRHDFTIRWFDYHGDERTSSLFGLFAAMARGEAASLSALRPHQREPWHAFAVQVGAMALIEAGASSPPTEEAGWRSLLLKLTPNWPAGEAWSLIGGDWDKPALLQPAVICNVDHTDYRSRIATPDALDMLVTSRNHDVKAERMERADDEDWFFALLTLQTTEGYLGAGNYGISRMNGGFASRMTLGLRPQGGLSAAWQRDVARLLEDRARNGSKKLAGIGLLWLVPWDGTEQLGFGELDPLYVDICRRVRLRRIPAGRVEASAAGSKVSRVAAGPLKGVTGDPWAPLKADGSTSVTPTKCGFGYRQITRLLQAKETIRPLLAQSSDADPDQGMAIIVAGLVRGQGKTEGLHRRTIPFSRSRSRKLAGEVFLDRVGEVASGRTDDAGQVASRLRHALLALIQGGPAKVRRDDAASGDKAERWSSTYDRAVDRIFFDDAFWTDVAREADAPRRAWRNRLRDIATDVFEEAAVQAPRTVERRIRAHAIARNILDGLLHRFVEDTADGD